MYVTDKVQNTVSVYITQCKHYLYLLDKVKILFIKQLFCTLLG